MLELLVTISVVVLILIFAVRCARPDTSHLAPVANQGPLYVQVSHWGDGRVYHSLLCGHVQHSKTLRYDDVKAEPTRRPCKHCKGKPFQLGHKP